MMTITVASSNQHFQEILALQRRYHFRAIPADVQAREGFVFAEHTLPLLKRMAAESPQVIALSGGRVVGYCLSLPPSLQQELPPLVPMFEQFGRCVFRDRPLTEYRFVVGGQVCVDRDYRGHGLLPRLYGQLSISLSTVCDLCVTEIATRNRVSVRAHEKMGFEAISTYSDNREEWVIVVWDFPRPALADRG
ncbi:MAG: GNAT family N-acetyltransferase [Rhodanobacteraceae bacterium]